MVTITAVAGPEVRPLTNPAAGAPAPQARNETAPRPHLEPPPAPEPDQVRKDLDEALAKLSQALEKVRPQPYRVAFEEDSSSGRMIIKIKNADGEVVKQYPPEKLLNLHQRMDDLVGMVVDEAT
ncbi:MAG TPA: flagellar protein FlaG [Candidatus Krumholzibacteria bacterium]|nr:flagellar protein FlaG [Candidatus Krumholzibacteria bacterium]